jgi:hypothetical protein
MWIIAVIGLGVFAITWIASRAEPRDAAARHAKQAEREIAALRCDLESSMRDATRWFEMDLPKPAWDSISDAFAILEALKTRIDRAEWTTLQSALLAAIPRALDAQPRPAPRKSRRRARRRSRMFA